MSQVYSPFQLMCSSGSIQGITINGVPLQGIGRVEQVWEEVLGSPELFGSAVHVPLRPGALDVPQVPGTREFGIGMILHGAGHPDQAGHNDAWRSLARMVWSPRLPLDVRRTVRFSTGDETHQCAAKYISGLGPNMIVPGSMSRAALRFRNIDGYWYALTDTVAGVVSGTPATMTVPGDAETHRMTITLSGGTGLQTLTNTTNGVLMTFNAPTTDTPVDIDVLGFTAYQDTTVQGENGPETISTPVVGSMTHTGDTFWMRMQPGSNTLTLTGGGTATIRVRAAYL